jgi:hypothetical protein
MGGIMSEENWRWNKQSEQEDWQKEESTSQDDESLLKKMFRKIPLIGGWANGGKPKSNEENRHYGE